MNIKLATTCFVIGALFAPVAVIAENMDTEQSQPMTYVQDSVITTKIKASLASEKMGSLLQIGVDTDSNGAVVLSGNTGTQEEADKAVSIARATAGVTSVTSNITINLDK